MRVTIGRGVLEIQQGDITEQAVDAVVNAANNHLWMGSGVAGAIKKKGGQQIETEAVTQGPIPVGAAVITSAGKLPARFVIHAAGMGQDLRTDTDKVRNATRSSLELAEKYKLTAIAFPAIGTGVGGLELHLCADTMLTETIEFLMKSTHCKTIRFVLFDALAYTAFTEQLQKIFSAPKKR